MEQNEKDEEFKKKSKQLKLLIEKYNKELEKVQEECTHAEEKVKMFHDENGTFQGLRKFCDSCNKVTGYPTQNESDDFYGKE